MAKTNTLLANDHLIYNYAPTIYSNNNQYQLLFTSVGDLAIYDMTLDPPGLVWNTGTAGKAPGGFAVLQTDGNLVVYNNADQPVWNTINAGATINEPGVHLVLQDDGALVAYAVKPVFNSKIWAPGLPAGAASGQGSGVNLKQLLQEVQEGEQVVNAIISIFG